MTAKMAAPTGPEIGNLPVSEAYRSRLADIVRRRGVKRVAYFHCDHFEPWRRAPGSNTTIEQNAEDVVKFAESSAKNEFARKLTLFYKAQVNVTRNIQNREIERAGGNDIFGFIERSADQVALFKSAISELRSLVPHEFQVHVHHEHFTSNSGHRDPELIKIFEDPAMAFLDEERVEIALRRSLAAIREETSLPLERWFFVHGVWALNASDAKVCNVTNEIALLMRYGGMGDFTFPAGRPNVDPRHVEPFFVKPIDAPRAYDLERAEPERAWGNAAAAKDKFFIWASPIDHAASSIDYFSPFVANKLQTPVPFASEILDQSVVKDGTLWFKTHGHSMHLRYAQDGQSIVHPHSYPPLIRLLGTVFDAAIDAGAEISFVTASEAYDAFLAAPQILPEARKLATVGRAVSESVAYTLQTLYNKINALARTFVELQVPDQQGNVPGLGAYYTARAAKGETLAPYELKIAEQILSLHPLERIYEVGSGLSLLPVLLAAAGHHAIGIERDQTRIAVARDLVEHLTHELDFPADQIELWGGVAPQALAQVDGRGAGIIFTNITATISEEDISEVIERAAKFDVAIIDLSRFFVVRDEAAQAQLLDRLVASGLQNPTPMSRTYYCFVRDDVENRQSNIEDETEEVIE
jgi:hypothetical protein